MHSRQIGSGHKSSTSIINEPELLKKFKANLHDGIFQTYRYYNQIRNKPLSYNI
jgi:hypothetical protein